MAMAVDPRERGSLETWRGELGTTSISPLSLTVTDTGTGRRSTSDKMDIWKVISLMKIYGPLKSLPPTFFELSLLWR